MPTQQMIDVIEYGRLFLLFDVKVHVRSGLKYIVEVISWIINYGHTHLLQEIVNHVECNNITFIDIGMIFQQSFHDTQTTYSTRCRQWCSISIKKGIIRQI
jgi:hypothetical protein